MIATTHGLATTFHTLTVTSVPSSHPSLGTARADGHRVLWRDTAARVSAALATVGHGTPLDTTALVVPTLTAAPPASADVAVALELLTARGALPADHALAAGVIVLGEFGLDGAVRPVRCVSSILRGAVEQKGHGVRVAVVPRGNAREVALVGGIEVRAVDTLRDVLELTRGYCPSSALVSDEPSASVEPSPQAYDPDLADIQGCEPAKRVLEIAAAGGHSVLLLGDDRAPTLPLARRLTTIMATMTRRERAECTEIASAAGVLAGDVGQVADVRPFRAPHHTVSGMAMFGTAACPGEVTRAHNGVLMLEHVLEFRAGRVQWTTHTTCRGVVSHGATDAANVLWPARALVVGSSWLCPCGQSALSRCRCAANTRLAWEARRRDVAELFDLVVKVDPHATTGSASNDRREHSAGVRTRVELARLFAAERADKEGLMGGAFADKAARQIIEADANMRRVDAVLRVARTIADLAGSAEIQDVHAREAEQYVPRSTKATFKVRRMAPVADGV